MEHTKGKLIIEPKLSDLGNLNPRFSIGIGDKILFHSTLENALANTQELLRRWNAFEKDGLVDELRAALKDVQKRIKNSEEWWIDCPDKGGFDADIIEAAIAKAKV